MTHGSMCADRAWTWLSSPPLTNSRLEGPAATAGWDSHSPGQKLHF